jgi:lysozyme
MTEGTMTYPGSSSPANPTAVSPPTNTDQGANNTEIKPPPLTSDNPVTKDFNFKAFECQLKIHEGVVNKSYRDSLGLPTAGIGHLLRENEIPKYPIGTPVSEQQVSDWFQQDAASSIATAQNFVGMETWSKIDDTRKRAVADLAYNMGPSRLGQFKTFRKNMQEGDYNAAGQSLRDSKWFTQVGNRGPKIIAMVEQGVDPNGCNKKFPPG